MHIAIDTSSAVRKTPSGVATALIQLTRALIKVAPADQFDLFVRFSRLRRWQPHMLPSGPNVTRRVLAAYSRWFYPRGLDVFHGMDARLPRFKACPMVVTVHDLFNVISEEFAAESFRRRRQAQYENACRAADVIITPSLSTKTDIVRELAVPAERIEVVPMGVSPEYAPQSAAAVEAARRKFGVPGEYILYVGKIERRKNVVRMVRAFKEIRRRHGQPLHFVLAGGLGYAAEEAVAAMNDPAVRDAIRPIGWCNTADLAALYSGARLLLFPTLYEGFGFPVLEAMACGTPVVTSNVSSMPEVAGDAAALVDPADEDQIAQAALAVLGDENRRARMIEKGLARDRLFTWETAARRTLEVYRRAVDGNGREK